MQTIGSVKGVFKTEGARCLRLQGLRVCMQIFWWFAGFWVEGWGLSVQFVQLGVSVDDALAAGGGWFFTARVPLTSSMALEGELVGDFGLEVYVLIEGCRGVV